MNNEKALAYVGTMDKTVESFDVTDQYIKKSIYNQQDN